MSRTRVVLPALLGLVLALLIVLAGANSPVAAFDDGRVNCHAASPIAIYCTDEGILVLTIAGQELLKISDDVLDNAVVPAVGEPPVTLGETDDNSVMVLLLHNGQYLVSYVNSERDPDELFLAFWTGCGPATANTADLKVFDLNSGELLSDADGCGEDSEDSEPVEGCVSTLICADDCNPNRTVCCYDSCVGPPQCVECGECNECIWSDIVGCTCADIPV